VRTCGHPQPLRPRPRPRPVDVAAALDGYGHAIERRVDLALIGDRVFVNNASASTTRGRPPRLNGAYRLDTLSGFGTRERIDTGVLGVVSVAVEGARDLPVLLAAESSGQLHRFRGYRTWTTPEFEVDSADELVDVGVDGEALRLPPPLRFRSLPGALRVRTPVDAPGAAPAAVAPRGISLASTALLRVLSGHPAR
jgi:diacylglycerol kinase family enzyme